MDAIEIVIGPDEQGIRMDRILCRHLSGISRTALQRWIQEGRVQVDGRVATKAGRALESGARVLVAVPESPSETAGETGEELRVLYSDDLIAVIDKQPGIAVHPNKNHPWGTIADLAQRRWANLPCLQGPDRPGIVHRLDRDTSGVMVLALTEAAMRSLRAQFKARTVRKEYRALVYGVPTLDSGWIELRIGRNPLRPDRMAAGVPAGREAQTYYEVLERFGGFSYLRCRPRSGRTHQIRVHLTAEGFPLLGDRVYHTRSAAGRRLPRGHPPVERQLLHAWSLQFDHPGSGEALEFTAPLPADMRNLRDFFREELPYEDENG